MAQVSFFLPPVQNLIPKQSMFLVEVFVMIKTDKILQEKVTKLRSLPDKAARDNFKKTHLPGVTFCGIFSKRGDQYIIIYSWIICVDIDALNDDEMAITKAALEDMFKELVGYFISPSGNGYKVLIKVDNNKFSAKENYSAAVAFLQKNIPIDVDHFDPSCSNPSRLTFLSYDVNARLNEVVSLENSIDKIPPLDTPKWLNKIVDINSTQPKNLPIPDVFTPYNRNAKLDFNHKSDISNFHILLSITNQKKGEYKSGNRHNFIQSLASYANQFGMSKDELKNYCLAYFENHPQTIIEKNVFDIDKELLPIIDDTYNRYGNQFGSWIEEEITEEMETPCFPQELYNNLPKLIAEPTRLFSGLRERDIFLLGMLGVLSTWMPKVQGTYDQKLLGPNLFIFFSAPPASDKGILLWARRLLKQVIATLKSNFEKAMERYEIDLSEYQESLKTEEPKEKPTKPLKQKIIIAGNISSAAIIGCIQANSSAMIFETEGDTVANTLNNNDWGNWSDILRKSFHHETVSLMRKKDNEDIEIERPYLSIVLSGTPSQIKRLVSSIENGFFSRILFYDFPTSNIWKNVFEKKSENFEKFFDGYAVKLEQLLAPYFYDKAADNNDVVSFELTPSQEEVFNEWFADKQTQLAHIYGEDIIASVRRLAICFFRIAMILSVMRHIEKFNENPSIYARADKIICTDTDFENAGLIINTLIFHTIKIFNQVKGAKRNKFSKGKRDMLLDKLPQEFNRAQAMEIALFIGIKEKTAESYLTQFIDRGLLQRPDHNQYRKIS